jgi:hypothetical protein
MARPRSPNDKPSARLSEEPTLRYGADFGIFSQEIIEARRMRRNRILVSEGSNSHRGRTAVLSGTDYAVVKAAVDADRQQKAGDNKWSVLKGEERSFDTGYGQSIPTDVMRNRSRNKARDEGRFFGSGEVLISSHGKLPRRSFAWNPIMAAIIALQHRDTALVWLGSKAGVGHPEPRPLHPQKRKSLRS